MSRKKASTKKGAAITITDPQTEKSASLNDPQAVRAILVDLVTRLGARGAEIDETDSSEMVAVEILAKAGGSAVQASKLIRDAESLGEIFAGTVLEEATAELSTKGDRPAKQIPLPKGKDLELTKVDASLAIEELWPIFRGQVEAGEGEISQTLNVVITWHPPTANRDGYVGVAPNMSVKGKKKTRTGTVSKRRGGGHQFNLFAEQVDD
jgi:hypothetical protein